MNGMPMSIGLKVVGISLSDLTCEHWISFEDEEFCEGEIIFWLLQNKAHGRQQL